MGDSAVIFADKLAKPYGNIEALHGVDLEVDPGEIIGFMGPNGAGKTTTIQLHAVKNVKILLKI
jgi:ABC-type multidrug transport system ATPase subunit